MRVDSTDSLLVLAAGGIKQLLACRFLGAKRLCRRAVRRAGKSKVLRTLLGGGIYLGLSTVVAQALGLIGTVLVARTLGRAEFGAYGVLDSTTLMIGTLASASLHVTTLKFVAQYDSQLPDKASRIYALCSLCSLTTGAAAAAVIAFTSDSLATYVGQPQLASIFRITALSVPFTAMTGVQSGRLLALKRFRAIALVNIMSSVARTVVLPSAALMGGLPFMAYGLVVHAVVTMLLHGYAIRATSSGPDRTSSLEECWQERGVLWTFAVPHLLAALVSAPAQWLPIMLLSHRPGGLEQVAILTAASKWRQFVLFLPGIVSKPGIPLMAESFGAANYGRAGKLLALSLGIILAATVPLVLMMVFASGALMAVFGDDFRADGIGTLNLVIGSALIQAIMVPLGDAMSTAGRNWAGLSATIVRSGTLVGLAAVFTAAGWGASGIALSQVLASLLMLMLQLFLLGWVFLYRRAA